MSGLNVLDRDTIFRKMAQMQDEINRLKSILQGVPITTVRIANASISTAKIADLAVTTAKIASISADKITTGTLSVFVALGATGKIKMEGDENRILIEDVSNDNRILIGKGDF